MSRPGPNSLYIPQKPKCTSSLLSLHLQINSTASANNIRLSTSAAPPPYPCCDSTKHSVVGFRVYPLLLKKISVRFCLVLMKMEPPAIPNATTASKKNNKPPPTKKKLPTPQELISHYQSQGLNSEAASIKVIEDLQNVLFRVISSDNRSKKDKLVGETSRKIDAVHARLAVVDMKLDSKPGYAEAFGIGVASAAAFRGIESVWPHVVGIWNAVRTATKPPST